jgi:hypothetical protein
MLIVLKNVELEYIKQKWEVSVKSASEVSLAPWIMNYVQNNYS